MATQEVIDLECIVEKPTWKQLLADLIVSERLDPWDINIVAIADGFLRKVREIKKLELLVPANVILASAILLRYKSTYLRLYEPQPEVMAITDGNGGTEIEAIPQLTISSRIPPKRQITLDELEHEIERVITYEGTTYVPKHKGGIDEIINFALTEEDIEKSMDTVYEKIRRNADDGGWATFSALVKGGSALDIIYALLSILYLTQKQVVDLRQDEVFGEILIHLNAAK